MTATTSILSQLISGLVKLPFAKLITIWGRPQGFALTTACVIIGLAMMAGCNGVKTYCAAQVFYSVGYAGMDLCMTIFIADTSSLRNRSLMLAFASSPYLATTWAYGPAAQRMLAPGGMGFRWGIGVWTIIYLVVATPLFSLFYYYHIQAEKAGLVPKKQGPKRSVREWLTYYAIEYDVMGLLLICAGLALFLLSFSLYSYQAREWRSPLIICLVIFGVLLIIAFILWERFMAPISFIPWHLIRNRTIIFTYIMVFGLYCSWYVWDNYFYSFLIVVFDQSVSQATYITNIYTVGSCFWVFITGFLLRYQGHLKWQALFFGGPLMILGNGLMIAFRRPGSHIGYIVICQIFVAFGGATLVICEQMTVMAVSSQQDIPAVLAVESMIVSVGGSIGSTIAAAIWTGVFPKKLAKYLPPSAQADLASIYGDLTVQSSYPVGSPTRNAIDRSYGETQRLMLITSTCLNVLTLLAPVFWKDVNVKGLEQVKGLVV